MDRPRPPHRVSPPPAGPRLATVRPPSAPWRRAQALGVALALGLALGASGAACAGEAVSASLSPVAGEGAGGPTLVEATSCEEAEAAVRGQAKLSLRLETARLRRAVLEGRLLPGASPPARAKAPSSLAGGSPSAQPWPPAPADPAARVGRLAVVADRVYAVTPHGLHVAPREPGAGLPEGSVAVSVPIHGDAWGVVAQGPWALVLSSMAPEQAVGRVSLEAGGPAEVVVLTRVDTTDLTTPRVVSEEAWDGHAYAARAAGGGVTLVLGAPWAVPGAATTPDGLTPDATEAEVVAAFDALDAGNDAAVDAVAFASLMPSRRGVLWSGALDATDVRPVTSCAALFYPAGVAAQGPDAAWRGTHEGAARGALGVGAAVTYVVTASAAPAGASLEARVPGALVGDWRHVAWDSAGGSLGAKGESLDDVSPTIVGGGGPGTAAPSGGHTLIARVTVGQPPEGSGGTLTLQAVAAVAGAPLGDRALAGLEGGRLLVATGREDGGARLTALSLGRGVEPGQAAPLSVWATWETDGSRGGAAVVLTDGVRAYVQPKDPWGAVAALTLAAPQSDAAWLGAGSGCAWVGLVPEREGRLAALRRCGDDGARLTWASFVLDDAGGGSASPVITGVAAGPGGGEGAGGDQDWTDIIWAQQSLWPLDAVGLIGVPLTTRVEEDAGWTSVRPALALYRSTSEGVEAAGVVVHPGSAAQESARMLDARERDGLVWTLSAAGLGATPVADGGAEPGRSYDGPHDRPGEPPGEVAGELAVGGGAGMSSFVALSGL